MARWWKTEGGAERDIVGVRESPTDDRVPIGSSFLQRLQRLIDLRAARWLTPEQRRFVDRALYATYWDCASIGARAEAVAALGGAGDRSRPVA